MFCTRVRQMLNNNFYIWVIKKVFVFTDQYNGFPENSWLDKYIFPFLIKEGHHLPKNGITSSDSLFINFLERIRGRKVLQQLNWQQQQQHQQEVKLLNIFQVSQTERGYLATGIWKLYRNCSNGIGRGSRIDKIKPLFLSASVFTVFMHVRDNEEWKRGERR